MAKKKRVTLDRDLREHMEQSLRDRGLDKPVYMQRIDDYIYFTDRLDEMKKDIGNIDATFDDCYASVICFTGSAAVSEPA